MKTGKVNKLRLNRETLRVLESDRLKKVAAAVVFPAVAMQPAR